MEPRRPGFVAFHGPDAQGIPVATFAIGSAGATNAALFAVAMLAGTDEAIDARYRAFRKAQSDKTFPLPPIEG